MKHTSTAQSLTDWLVRFEIPFPGDNSMCSIGELHSGRLVAARSVATSIALADLARDGRCALRAGLTYGR